MATLMQFPGRNLRRLDGEVLVLACSWHPRRELPKETPPTSATLLKQW